MKKHLTLALIASLAFLSQPLKAEETVSLTQKDPNNKYKLSFVTSGQTARLTKIELLYFDADIVIPETVEDEYGDTYTVTIIGAKQDDKSADPDMWDNFGTADKDCRLFRDVDPDYAQSIVGLTLPSTITAIWPNAFYQSTLKTIKIPDSVTEIGAGAFNLSELTEITLPDLITEIQGYTFNQCSKLNKVTIGSNITSIWESAFDGISATAAISIDTATPPNINRYSFSSDCAATVTVPYGTSDAYAEKWAMFSNMNFVEMEDGQTSAASAPTARHFEIDCNNGLVSSDDDSPIEIFDFYGAKIYSGYAKNQKLANGFYIIKCKEEAVKVYVK